VNRQQAASPFLIVAVCFGWLAAWPSALLPAPGQTGEVTHPASPLPASSAAAKTEDYTIGPGDVLSLKVQDMPELAGKYRVTRSGYLVVPGLPDPVKAEGLTTIQLSRDVAAALKSAQLLLDPVVDVQIEEFHSRVVTVLGAVQKPSVYVLDRPKVTVLEVVSLAGGLTPTAGHTITLQRANSSSATGDSAGPVAPGMIPPLDPTEGSVEQIELGKLIQGQDPGLNVEVHPGDIVTVSTAPVVYVVGAVNRPGGFVFQDPGNDITVLKALGLAEGLSRIAAGDRAIIVRHPPDSAAQLDLPIDVGKLMAGKINDQPLEANDILFVPESGMKKTVQRLGAAASVAIQGAIYYSVGNAVVH